MAYLLLSTDDINRLVDILAESRDLLSKSDRVHLLDEAGLGEFLNRVSIDLPARDYGSALLWELRAAGTPPESQEPVLVSFLRTVRARVEGHAELVGFLDRLLAQPHAERYEGPRRPLAASGARTRDESREERDQQILLQKVREFWIEGILERNVPAVAAIDLRKVTRTDLVENPLASVLPREQPARPVAPDTPLLTLFEEQQSSLLITGAPGAGKTMTLLSLARALVERAEQIPGAPVPVIFNLSSWGAEKRALVEWLADELAKYQIPRKAGRAWLQVRDILPLLDGLDEVEESERSDCVRAINHFLSESGPPGIAVCCRLAEYERLETPLALGGALEILPLTLEEADAYLARLGPPLDGLRAALPRDPLLSELAASPLMLHVLSEVYTGAAAPDIGGAPSESGGFRIGALWDGYIRKMFAREGRSRQDLFQPAALVERLAWLASRMREHGQSIFHMEALQPSWLDSTSGRWMYAVGSRFAGGAMLTAAALLAGLGEQFRPESVDGLMTFLLVLVPSALLTSAGLAAAAGLRLTAENTAPAQPMRTPARQVRSFLGATLSAAFPTAVLFAVAAVALDPGWRASILSLRGLFTTIGVFLITCVMGVPFGLTYGLRTNGADVRSDIQLVEALQFSGRGALRGALTGLISGFTVTAFILMLVSLFEIVLAAAQGAGFQSEMAATARRFPRLMIALGLPLTYFGAVLGALVNGIQARAVSSKTRPNEGVRRCASNALKSFVVYFMGGIPLLGGTWLLFWLTDRVQPFGVMDVLAPATSPFLALFWWLLLAGTIGALYNGGLAVIQHYVLRFVLARLGRLPRDLPNFLEEAADLTFMQRVGSGYIFFHRQLQEHFAAMTPRTTERPSRETKVAEPHARTP